MTAARTEPERRLRFSRARSSLNPVPGRRDNLKPMAVEAAESTHECRHCHRALPVDEMQKRERKGRDGPLRPSSVCKQCHRDARARRLAEMDQRDRGADGTLVEQPGESDPGPARQLRRRLAVARKNGASFEEVWQLCVDLSVHEIAAQGIGRQKERRDRLMEEAASWAIVFEQTEGQWHAAYEGVGPGLKLTMDVFAFDSGSRYSDEDQLIPAGGISARAAA